MQRLVALLREHRGPLRADFLREYQLDLDAVLAGNTMSPAVLLDLIDGLSAGSITRRVVDPDSAWGLQEHLMASMVDELRLLSWAYVSAHSKRRVKAPKPIPRPGVVDDVQREIIGAGEGFDSIEEFEAWYAAAKAGCDS